MAAIGGDDLDAQRNEIELLKKRILVCERANEVVFQVLLQCKVPTGTSFKGIEFKTLGDLYDIINGNMD